MGLSASQAKLLSITARISDNELRSQTITAAKMSLANRSTAASRDYVNALNSTELTYRTYDLDGNKTYVDLTGAQLSQYAPLKNQYALVNNKGQVLVSELDAGNYETSNTLNEFLEKYGVQAIPTGETMAVENPEYQVEYEKWEKEYGDWLLQKPDPMDEKYWEVNKGQDSELYDKFKKASAGCYNSALNGSSQCYLHVLAHMIDLETDGNGNPINYPKHATTTLGGDITLYRSMSDNSAGIVGSTINWGNNTEPMVPVSDAIRDGWKGQTVMAAEHSSEDPTEIDTEAKKLISDFYLKEAKENGTEPTELQRLMSNYTYDANGEVTLKTLHQKCIDLYYAVFNKIADYRDILLPAIDTFQKDMEVAFTENIFLREKYEKDENEWKEREPKMKDISATIEKEIFEYSDKDKAQWYVNLWHRMNGGQSDEKNGEITNSEIHTIKKEDGTYEVVKTDTIMSRYDILEDGLMNSPEWLKYAFESGTVTLERVNFADPTEKGTGLKDAEWTSIIYTNALDISEQTNEAAITKAEAEYEAATREIESKDKQYDSMLKLLDTEHSALQTEYDSVKSVISKNMERTLKMYSA